jgi:hypothetical protein
MQKILSEVRRFFIRLRLVLPLLPQFVLIAFRRVAQSTVDYWKESQSVVEEVTDNYTNKAMQRLTTEHDVFVYWTCYSLSSFLYLLGWLVQAWLTVEAFRLLTSWIF